MRSCKTHENHCYINRMKHKFNSCSCYGFLVKSWLRIQEKMPNSSSDSTPAPVVDHLWSGHQNRSEEEAGWSPNLLVLSYHPPQYGTLDLATLDDDTVDWHKKTTLNIWWQDWPKQRRRSYQQANIIAKQCVMCYPRTKQYYEGVKLEIRIIVKKLILKKNVFTFAFTLWIFQQKR